MKNISLKYSLFAILGLSLLVYFILLGLIIKEQLTFRLLLKTLPKVVSVDVLIIGLFSSYLWKFKIFKGWLVKFPNLGGTWKGYIQTTWIDSLSNSRPDQIPVILTIKQSFFRISCVMRTKEMTSRSVISDFVIDKDNQVKRLFYSYDSNPIATVKDRSPQHLGTAYFDIIEKTELKLIGEYWTARKTTGHIELSFWKKEHVDDYPTELGEHPVSHQRNNRS